MRRLHSLAGIIPVGGFLLFHLWENYKAHMGAEAYNATVRAINSLPAMWFFEIFLIFIPLYFHAIYGIYIALDAKHNVDQYRYRENVAFVLHRIAGLITLFFVTYHIWQFRFQKFIGAYGSYVGGDSMSGLPSFEVVAQAFANNGVFTFYLIGIVAAVYHLCNGIYTFLITWGITAGPKSQRISAIVTRILFVAVSVLGVLAAFSFR